MIDGEIAANNILSTLWFLRRWNQNQKGRTLVWITRGTWAPERLGKGKDGKKAKGSLEYYKWLLSVRIRRSGLPSNVAVPDSVSSPAASFLFTFLKTTPDFHQIKMIKSSQLFLLPNLNLVIYYRGWVWLVCFKEPQTTVFAPVDEAEKHKTPKICINYPK